MMEVFQLIVSVALILLAYLTGKEDGYAAGHKAGVKSGARQGWFSAMTVKRRARK